MVFKDDPIVAKLRGTRTRPSLADTRLMVAAYDRLRAWAIRLETAVDVLNTGQAK